MLLPNRLKEKSLCRLMAGAGRMVLNRLLAKIMPRTTSGTLSMPSRATEKARHAPETFPDVSFKGGHVTPA